MKTQDELWGNVFAIIKQYGLNKEVLDKLKEKYIISVVKYARICPHCGEKAESFECCGFDASEIDIY